MDTLQAATDLIKKYEGCQLTAYQDSIGIWTIGWGSTLGIHRGMTITQALADTKLRYDINDLALRIEGMVKRTLNDRQLCALIDFSYNLGLGSLHHSLLLTQLNAGVAASDVAEQFLLWCHAGGKLVPQLLERRREEAALFLS